MSDAILEVPALPNEPDDSLLVYSDYVFSAYVITALVLGVLLVRSFSRAKKSERIHALLMAQSEKSS